MRDFYLYSTLTRQKQKFEPLLPGKVMLYACGPTVYHDVHIGNLRTFTSVDVLRRVLTGMGYQVDHVMNITDVGHLTQEDLDSGDDRLEKSAKAQNKTPQEIAQYYTEKFQQDMERLNLLPPTHMPKASEHVAQMIIMIRELQEKGHAYETDTAVYFSVETFPHYTQLSGQKLEDKIQAARQEVQTDPQKQHPADFALWFKAVGNHAQHLQTWDSPWGKGFPGWHIECSAMVKEYFGDSIDIHAGGVDLIGTHHTNEIAQSESLTGKPFVHYWIHVEHLLINAAKMARSEGTGIGLAQVKEKGIDPEAFRYFLLTAHYRSKLNFTWEGLQEAQTTLDSIRELVANPFRNDEEDHERSESIWQALLDDMDTPKVLMELHQAQNGALWQKFGPLLGLDFTGLTDVDEKVEALMHERQQAREAKDWSASDQLRTEIEQQGYTVIDTPQGSYLWKKAQI